MPKGLYQGRAWVDESWAKTMEKQRFKTIDLGFMFALLGVTFAVVIALVGQQSTDPDKVRALLSAQNLTLQLSAGGLGSLKPEEINTGRGPASVENTTSFQKSMKLFGRQGKIGQDPWGNSFRFNFVGLDEQKGNIYVVVWSDGPDQKSDTTVEITANLKMKGKKKQLLRLNGDDLGYIRVVGKASLTKSL